MPSFIDGAGRPAMLPAKPAHVGLFIALAAFFQVLESLIPTPLPWLRLGLGNGVVLAALVLWGGRTGAQVAAGKVVLGAMVTGKLLGPAFLLSAAGSAASVAVMAALYRAPLPLGVVGISVAGAAAHLFAQLLLAGVLLFQELALFHLAGIVGIGAVGTGIVTGVAAHFLYATARAELSGGSKD